MKFQAIFSELLLVPFKAKLIIYSSRSLNIREDIFSYNFCFESAKISTFRVRSNNWPFLAQKLLKKRHSIDFVSLYFAFENIWFNEKSQQYHTAIWSLQGKIIISSCFIAKILQSSCLALFFQENFNRLTVRNNIYMGTLVTLLKMQKWGIS